MEILFLISAYHLKIDFHNIIGIDIWPLWSILAVSLVLLRMSEWAKPKAAIICAPNYQFINQIEGNIVFLQLPFRVILALGIGALVAQYPIGVYANETKCMATLEPHWLFKNLVTYFAIKVWAD
jgi:hypothetical protein